MDFMNKFQNRIVWNVIRHVINAEEIRNINVLLVQMIGFTKIIFVFVKKIIIKKMECAINVIEVVFNV